MFSKQNSIHSVQTSRPVRILSISTDHTRKQLDSRSSGKSGESERERERELERDREREVTVVKYVGAKFKFGFRIEFKFEL